MPHCPLCGFSQIYLFYIQKKVNWSHYYGDHDDEIGNQVTGPLNFYKCENCALVFKDRTHALSLTQQKPRYLRHKNDLTPEYQKFLEQLWLSMKTFLKFDAHGLDYGCGPVKALESILGEGFSCVSYDPVFYNDETLLSKSYDFVFCSEVVEHFLNLDHDWHKLKSLIKTPEGLLGVMTAFVPEDFENWHYHRDPTHVSFYSPMTINWISKNLGFEVKHRGQNIVLLSHAR